MFILVVYTRFVLVVCSSCIYYLYVLFVCLCTGYMY